MAFRNVSVFLQANVSSFVGQMGVAASATKNLGNEINTVASKGDLTVKRIGTAMVAVGALMAAAFGLSAKMAIDFEAQMRNVNSIAHLSETQFRSTSEQVLALSRRFPQSAATLAAGLYDISSSGFQGAEGMTVLRSATLAASAGLSTTAVAAKGITAVLNAYGLSAAHSADVADTLFAAVDKGVVTFEELSAQIGDVVGTAAAAGISFDQVAAGMATITLSGINAAEASTSLNQVMRAMINPSDAMTAKLHELGYESGVAALKALGLRGVMDLLRQSTGGSIEELVKLFPEIRGARGALALMANEGQNAASVFGFITDESARAGAAQKAYDEQSKSTAVQLGLLKSAASAFGIELGQQLLPAIRGVVGFVTNLAHGLADLPGPVQTLLFILMGLATIVIGLGGAFLLLAPKAQAAKTLFAEMATTAPRLATGLTAVSIAAGIATAALVVGAVVVAKYAKEKAEATARVERFIAALEAEATGTENATRSLVVKELAEQKMLGVLDQLGLSTKSTVDAILGEQDAVQNLSAELLQNLPATARTAANQKLLVEALNGSNSAYESFRHQFADARFATDKGVQGTLGLVKVVGNLSDANTDATLSFRETNKALKDSGAASDDTKQKLSALDAMFATAADGAAKLTGRQKQLADALKDFATPLSVYTDALAKKSSAEHSSFRGSGNDAELAASRQMAAFEQTVRARQTALDESIRAERDAYDEKRRLIDAELAAEIAAYDARQRITERGFEDERDALSARQEAVSRQLEDERTALEQRQRAEKDSLVQGVDETRDQFQARKDLLDQRQQTERDAFDQRKRLLERNLEDERSALDERVKASRRAAEDEKQVLTDRADASRTALEEEKRLMEDRQVAMKTALDEKDRVEKDQLEEQKRTNKSMSTSWSDMKDDVVLTLGEYVTALEKSNTDALKWQQNLVIIAQRAGTDVALAIANMGEKGIGLAAAMATGTDAEVQRMATALVTNTKLGADGARSELEQAFAIMKTLAESGGQAIAANLATKLAEGKVTVGQVVSEYGGLLKGELDIIARITGGVIDVGGGRFRTYVPGKGFVGVAMEAAGGYEAHTAQVARGGDWRVWAEPETQGESYIPHADDWRRPRAVDVLEQTANLFGFTLSDPKSARGQVARGQAPSVDEIRKMAGMAGYTLAEYAAGGITAPPLIDQGGVFGLDANRAAGLMYAMAAGMSRGQLGTGWQAITEYLKRQGVPFTVTSTTGGVHAPGSLHYVGKAVDLVSMNMRQIFEALAVVKSQVQELFFTPAGYSIKNGVEVRPPIAAADHFDHVHAATYDRGGWLRPGLTLAYNGTGNDELVSPKPGVPVMAGGGGGGEPTFAFHVDVRVNANGVYEQSALAAVVRRDIDIGVSEAMRTLVREIRMR